MRKSHSKSRFGCSPCKKRHIKCGEEYPSCRNCVNRCVKCVYDVAPVSSPGADARKACSEDARSKTHWSCYETREPVACPCQQSAMNLAPVGTTRLQELRLAIHYATTTCETLAHDSTDISVWKEVVPQEAALHDFLMDGLLALSSLHFASQNSSLHWQYTEIAIKYQNAGLQKYKYALERITQDNHGALFAFSIILNVLALAFPNVCSGPSHSSHMESITILMELLQGVSVINNANQSSLQQGGFAALFQSTSPIENDSALCDGTVDALGKLRERADILAGPTDAERHQLYILGIDSLEEVFRHMNSSRHLGQIFTWPLMAGKGLSRLFKQNDPMTQFIFMHYGVLLLYARDRWWGRNTGVCLIENLANSLHTADPEWVTWTQWARERASAAHMAQDC